MALVIYPTVDYDSFITVVDATTTISEYTLHSAIWLALTIAEQEVYLRIAARNIIDHIDQELTPFPDVMPSCVGEAQALMAVQDVVYGFSAQDTVDESGSIKKEKVASLEIEYYDTKSKTAKRVSVVPDMAMLCLEDIGYVLTPHIGGLTQTILGRS